MVIRTGARENAAVSRMEAVYVIWELVISFILFLLPFDLLYVLELFDSDGILYFGSSRFVSFRGVV